MKLKDFLNDELSISPGSVKLSIKSQLEKYRDKYDALISDTSKKIKTDTYRVNPGGRVIVHFKIPSQSLTNFYYDVLLELTPVDKASSFEDCEIRLFSNSPSFVFGGYAYVFYHLDPDMKQRKSAKQLGMMIDMFKHKIPRDRLLMPGTEKKLGKEAVTEEPVIRNPMGIPIPDSSIYFAIFHMIDNMDYRRTMDNHNNVSEKQVIDSVSGFEHLMVLRRRETQKEQKEHERKNTRDQALVKKPAATTHRSGSTVRVKSPSSPIRVSGSGNRTPKTNSNRTGGVNRIG